MLFDSTVGLRKYLGRSDAAAMLSTSPSQISLDTQARLSLPRVNGYGQSSPDVDSHAPCCIRGDSPPPLQQKGCSVVCLHPFLYQLTFSNKTQN